MQLNYLIINAIGTRQSVKTYEHVFLVPCTGSLKTELEQLKKPESIILHVSLS